MTFKGCRYASILELDRLLHVAKIVGRAYEFELKCKRLQRDKISADEVNVKLNLQNKFIEELESLEDDLLNQIDIISDDLNDLEAKVFKLKFILGKDNSTIENELSISRTTLNRLYSQIEEAMKTDEGKNLKTSLNEE